MVRVANLDFVTQSSECVMLAILQLFTHCATGLPPLPYSFALTGLTLWGAVCVKTRTRGDDFMTSPIPTMATILDAAANMRRRFHTATSIP